MSSAPGRAVGAPSAGLSQFRGAESCRRVTTRVHSGRRLLVPTPTVCRSDVRRACRCSHRRKPLGPSRPAPVRRYPYHPSTASAASASATTRASSRSSPARCARSRRSVERGSLKQPPTAPSSRSWPCSCARSAPGSRPTPRSPRPSAPSSSSGSTASRRSWPRPPPATPRCFALLAEDAVVSDAARALKREMLDGRRARGRARGGRRPRRPPALRRDRAPRRPAVGDLPPARQPVPRPRLLQRAAARRRSPRQLATWELLGPLFRSFEERRPAARLLHAAARARVAEGARVASS